MQRTSAFDTCPLCGKRKGKTGMNPKERAYHDRHCVPTLLEQAKARKPVKYQKITERVAGYLSKED